MRSASQWQRVQKARYEQKESGEKRGLRKWERLMLVGYVLMALALWGVLSIYGPVLAAEVTYQTRKASGNESGEGFSLWRLLTPNLSFELVPEEIATGYGIVIPKIFLTEPVVFNVDPSNKKEYVAALQEGIAHAAGTRLPGEGGLGYYFAHSSGMRVLEPQKKAVFYLLGKLEPGDEVRIYRDREKFVYKVTDKRVVEATDLSFLDERYNSEVIVLQTCWPIGTSLQRMLVFAERVEG